MTPRSHGTGRLLGLGYGFVAASAIIGTALAQSDRYDSSSGRTQIRYGMARDTVASTDDGQSDSPPDRAPPATHGRWVPTRGDQTSPFAAKNAVTEPDAEPVQRPRHKIESPRAGTPSDVPKEQVTEEGPKLDAPANSQPDAARHPAPRHTYPRSDVVRSSYSPAAYQDCYSNSPAPSPPQQRRPTGWVDSMTKQFSPPPSDGNNSYTPSQRYDSSYGHYPRRARLAMADQSVVTHSADPQPMDSPMRPGEELPPGAHVGGGHMEMGPPHGEWIEGEGPPPGYGEGGCGYGDCDECGSCGGCCCRPLCALLNCPSLNEWCQDLSVYTGEQGFLGPVDQGLNGNFGFHEGVNWGTPLWDEIGLGAQVGIEADQSDLSGFFAEDSTRTRRQYFFTTGVFHTPQCGCGLQGGLVWDYLNDRSLDDFSVSQLRGDLSYVFNSNEIGFWFTAGVSDMTLISSNNVNLIRSNVTYTPIDLYAFYFGHKFCGGAEARIWGGWAGGGLGGLFGGDFSVPLGEQLSLDADFNYRIPNSLSDNAVPLESWNIALSVVWRPWRHGCGECCDSYRPLFNVANNGSFMVNRNATPIPVPGGG